MPAFSDYTLKTAQEIIQDRADDAAIANLKFYNGDHWSDADGWSGPAPKSTDASYAITIAEIEKAFVSRNAIAEVVSRHVSGVLGRELHWSFTPARPLGTIETTDPKTGQPKTEDEAPTEQEQALIDEAEAALTEWWDKREAPGILQDMVKLALLSKRAVLRLYVPPGLRDESGNIPTGDLAQSLDKIWPQHLGTNEDTLDLEMPSATVFVDKNTRRTIGIFTYKEEKEDGTEGPERAELCYVDDATSIDPETALTILRIAGEGVTDQPVLMPLGGRLTLYEMIRPALVSEQIVSQQKLLNLALTMKQRNVVLGGFLERVLLNAQLPGTMQRQNDGTEKFVPDPFYVGAGSTNALVGVKFTDANGNESIATPSVVYRDPVPVTTFAETEQSAYLAILQEAQQLHYALAGDAVVSGESRRQARDAFQKDLQLTAGKVEAAARWLLETTLAMASFFSGQAGRFETLRAVVQARVDSGPVSAEERKVTREMHDAGLLSRESAMSEIGVEDVDAEIERIERERETDQTPTVDEVEELLRRGQGTPTENAPPSQNGREPVTEEAAA